MDSTTRFFKEINKYEVLDHKVQIEYLKKAQNGCKESRDKLIKHNIRLVISIAKRYTEQMELLDLVQSGVFGLNDAIDRFEIDKGTRFSTYAHWWILRSINAEIIENSRTIRIPAYLYNSISALVKAENELLDENKEPTAEKLAEKLDMDVDRVKLILDVRNNTLSLDYENDEKNEFKEMLVQNMYAGPEESVYAKERALAIDDALNTLNPLHKKILVLRYGLTETGERKTLKEISKIVGITKERVRQIEVNCLEVLKDGSGRSDRRRRIKEFM